MTNINGMLTIPEVAKLLHIHPSTVRQWTNKGLLPTYCIGTRGDRRFKRKEIDSFIKRAKYENTRL